MSMNPDALPVGRKVLVLVLLAFAGCGGEIQFRVVNDSSDQRVDEFSVEGNPLVTTDDPLDPGETSLYITVPVGRVGTKESYCESDVCRATSYERTIPDCQSQLRVSTRAIECI